MQQWLIAAVAPALAGFGYLIRRWMEGRRRGEVLKRRLQALKLWKGMKRTGLTMQDLDRLGEDT